MAKVSEKPAADAGPHGDDRRPAARSVAAALAQLTASHSPLATPDSRLSTLDAQTLLAHITGRNRAWLLAHPEAELTPAQAQALEAARTRLQNGEPLPYILGHWEFFGLDFLVTPDTLIPRPETELLVEEAIKVVSRESSVVSKSLPATRYLLTADIGTGSGCIAVSLAVHVPELQVVASDISAAALQIARQNARRHAVAERVHFVQSDLLTFAFQSVTTETRSARRIPDKPRKKLRERCVSVVHQPSTSNFQLATSNLQPPTFPLICANLPYIPTATLRRLEIYGREPTLALDGGPDGLDLIRRLLSQAAHALALGGVLLLEIESTQGRAARSLARQFFPQARITLLPDLAGHDRLLKIRT